MAKKAATKKNSVGTEHREAIDELRKKLKAEHEKLAGAIQAFNETLSDKLTTLNSELAEVYEPVKEARDAYNEALQELAGKHEEVHGELDEAFQDASERYRESAAGEALREWIDKWGSGIDEPYIEDEFPEVEVDELAVPEIAEELTYDPE